MVVKQDQGVMLLDRKDFHHPLHGVIVKNPGLALCLSYIGLLFLSFLEHAVDVACDGLQHRNRLPLWLLWLWYTFVSVISFLGISPFF